MRRFGEISEYFRMRVTARMIPILIHTVVTEILILRTIDGAGGRECRRRRKLTCLQRNYVHRRRKVEERGGEEGEREEEEGVFMMIQEWSYVE